MKELPPRPQITIQTTPLQKVNHMKILGFIMSSDLKWSLHIRNIVTMANGKLFMLKMVKKFNLAVEALLTIYKGYIGSLLECAVPVWNAVLAICQSNELEQVQKRALRIILGQLCSDYDQALQLCDFPMLKQCSLEMCL